MKIHVFMIVMLIGLLAACATPEPEVPPTPEPVVEPEVQKPVVTLLTTPEEMVSGEVATFTWKVEGGKEYVHTNMHSSFSEDMSDRTDSEKQDAKQGEFTGTLTLETEEDMMVYVMAHAHVDGEEVTSKKVAISLKAPEPEGATHQIEIKGYAYHKEDLMVNVGDTVVWTNSDDVAHTVNARGLESGDIKPGETYTYTATKPGQLVYNCNYHSMKGALTVN